MKSDSAWSTRLSNIALVALLIVLGCSSTSVVLSCSSKDGGSNGSNAAGGSGGTNAAGKSGASGGASGGAGGALGNLCAADPRITSCGSETCSPVAPNLAAICVQTCCTSDMKCGTRNANVVGLTMCMAKVQDTSMCPGAMILGSQVPGCCVPGGNLCGLQDQSGIFGGGCVPRCAVGAISSGIANVNCDGTPAGACPTTGGGGRGAPGSAGGASGGAGTSGGVIGSGGVAGGGGSAAAGAAGGSAGSAGVAGAGGA